MVGFKLDCLRQILLFIVWAGVENYVIYAMYEYNLATFRVRSPGREIGRSSLLALATSFKAGTIQLGA